MTTTGRRSRRAPATPSVPRRHARGRRRSTGRSALALVAGTLAVVLVSGSAVAAVAVTSLATSVQSVDIGNEASVAGVDIAAIKGGANILVVGSDTRLNQVDDAKDKQNTGARNDVTILVHISEDHKAVSVVSFPRDTIIDIPKCTAANGTVYPAVSGQLLNTALGRGGLSCAVSTIESMTGLSIPYAGMVTFDGVVQMSNAVGGVSVCIANSIDDPLSKLHLSAGQHTLKGKTALAFLRTRHGVGDGSDLARISSQQVYLASLMRTLTDAGTLSNPITLYSLGNAALSNMQLSTSLSSVSTLVSLAEAMKGVNLNKVVFAQYPTVADPADANRVIPDVAAAAQLNTALVKDRSISLAKGSTGRASEVATGAAAKKARKAAREAAAASAAASATPTATPTATATPTPTATATPTAGSKKKKTVTLSQNVTGQTAAQQTCSVGNGG